MLGGLSVVNFIAEHRLRHSIVRSSSFENSGESSGKSERNELTMKENNPSIENEAMQLEHLQKHRQCFRPSAPHKSVQMWIQIAIVICRQNLVKQS